MWLHFVLSFVFIVPIMVIWIMIANVAGWSFFTGWGMVHGGFAIALPVSWLISFGVLALLPGVRRAWDK